MLKKREKWRKRALPGWLFVLLMAVFHELVLHLWIASEIQWGRLAAVCAFGCGFGCVLALPVSLIANPKAEKWTAVALSVTMSVIWLVEYFVSDAYQVFMAPGLVMGGAGGVAKDYLGLVLSLLARNLWRIALLLVPTVLYALLFRGSEKRCWKRSVALALCCGVCYGGGLLAVHSWTRDAGRLGATYDFDSAVRCFGLHMGLTLDATHKEAAEEILLPVAPAEPPVLREPATQSQKPEPQPEAEPEVVYEDNIMTGWDPAALAQTEKVPAISALHSYVAGVTPSKKNAYTGLFAGKNLILITAEAFTAEVIDPERTPTLYRMANQGIRFTDYYQPAWGASTTSGEFSNVIGLVPATNGMCMREGIEQHLFLTMGHQLQRLGYSSVAYHNHNADFYYRDETHVHLGYDRFLAQFGGLDGITPVWPESDLEMIDVSVPQYIDSQPFSVYYMTVSGHSLCSRNANAQARKNYNQVADLDVSEPVKCYLAANLELEKAMTSLLRQLEEAGIADDTVIVIAPDHYPYGLESSDTWNNSSNYLAQLFGVEHLDKFSRDHSALIIWSGCLEGQEITVDEPVYSLDILPTLSNLFGVEYDSRLLVGRDVFSEQTPLVLWQDHSWRTDQGSYEALSGTYTPAEGKTMTQEYIDYISAVVSGKIAFSKSVQTNNYYNNVSQALGLERGSKQ